MITLLLAVSDRFGKGYGVSDTQAKEFLARVKGEYERAYYAGILAERRAKAKLAPGHSRLQVLCLRWLSRSHELVRKSGGRPPAGNDDALLRWNTCARIITQNKLVPREEEQRGTAAGVR